MSRPTKITIDLNALTHNLRVVRKLVPHSAIMAMVKANAYGHGLQPVGLALKEADALAVACVEEGILLRKTGIKMPIVLLEGLFADEELSAVVTYDFTIIVHHQAQVELLEKHSVIKPISIWLKIDTGMHRLGVNPSEVPRIYQRLMNCSSVKKPIGLMTHFAESDASDKTATLQQIRQFDTVTGGFSGPRTLANSAAILRYPETHKEWVRPGIMLYGASPVADCDGTEYHLQPVMSLTSALIALHLLKKGDRVGYGGTWTCPDDRLIGVVAVGYGDGYPRHARNGTPVLVNGKMVPLVGRVSMDMITVDLQTQPQAKVGDPVILWGKGLPVETVAKSCGTISYELLTRMTQRPSIDIINANPR